MPKRIFNQFFGTKIKGPCELYVKVTIGATGAPTLVTTTGHSKGITSIARTGTGAYTLTLADKYAKCLGLYASWLHASASTIGGIEMVTEAVASTGVITFITKDVATGGGAAADPANGTVMYFRVLLDASKS